MTLPGVLLKILRNLRSRNDRDLKNYILLFFLSQLNINFVENRMKIEKNNQQNKIKINYQCNNEDKKLKNENKKKRFIEK